MDFDTIRDQINQHMLCLPDSRTKVHDAENLASKFLSIQHVVTDGIYELELDMHEIRSVSKMLFHHALSQSDKKNATEKKAEAEANDEYRDAEKLERDLKSKITFLKIKQSIFNDAHLVCRTIMREG